MALACNILGKFLGVGCHSFPPPWDVPTFVAMCLHILRDARDPSSKRWKCGREHWPVILPKWQFPRHLGIFYMPQMGPMDLLPLTYLLTYILVLKNPMALAGFEPGNLGTKGQHANPRPPQLLVFYYITKILHAFCSSVLVVNSWLWSRTMKIRLLFEIMHCHGLISVSLL